MESLTAYLAVDTAAAIGAQTVGIQLPLSDIQVLTMGFCGRRRPDVVWLGHTAGRFYGDSVVQGHGGWLGAVGRSGAHLGVLGAL